MRSGHVAHSEKTLAIIKPDAVERMVIGKIISLIESNGLCIRAMKMVHLTAGEARKFYAVHTGKSFFDGLVEFMSGGPSVVLVLEGERAIETWRTLMGPTDPQNAPEGSIRRSFGTDTRHNATHGSDSTDAAITEIAFFFSGLDQSHLSFSQEESGR